MAKIAESLSFALDNWEVVEPKLRDVYQKLNNGELTDTILVNQEEFHSPLPRTYQWADGSAYIHHIKLVRMARNAPLPETLTTVPLMYQGEVILFGPKRGYTSS